MFYCCLHFPSSLIVQLIIICNLIINIRSPTPPYERSLAESYKVDGVVEWRWDPNSFCKSRASVEEILSFRRAIIFKMTIMLEMARCTRIHMKVLYCEYALNEHSEESEAKWRGDFFINGLGSDVFRVHKPQKSICNDPHTWTIQEQTSDDGIRLPIVQSFSSYYTDPPHEVARIEKSLADYYKAFGAIKWMWKPKLICRLQTPPGLVFRKSFITMRYVTLQWSRCSTIQIAVLHCEYSSSRPIFDLGTVFSWHSYMSGPNGELFSGGLPGRSSCNEDSSLTGIIQSEILNTERVVPRNAKLFGIANIFKILFDHRRGKLLPERKWPQIPVETSEESSL